MAEPALGGMVTGSGGRACAAAAAEAWGLLRPGSCGGCGGPAGSAGSALGGRALIISSIRDPERLPARTSRVTAAAAPCAAASAGWSAGGAAGRAEGDSGPLSSSCDCEAADAPATLLRGRSDRDGTSGIVASDAPSPLITCVVTASTARARYERNDGRQQCPRCEQPCGRGREKTRAVRTERAKTPKQGWSRRTEDPHAGLGAELRGVRLVREHRVERSDKALQQAQVALAAGKGLRPAPGGG